MKLKMSKKKAVIGIIVLCVVGAGAYKMTSGGAKQNESMVNMTQVAQGDIEETITLKGPLTGTESVEVVSSLHQEVLSIVVKEGDKVKKGQLLAMLDTTDLEKEISAGQDNIALLGIQLSESRKNSASAADLAQAQLDERIKTEQKEYEKTIDTYNEAKRQYDNTKVLCDEGIEPLESLTKAQLELDNAKRLTDGFTVENGAVVPTKADIQSIQNTRDGGGVAATEKSIEIAKKELERKKEKLEDCRIKSNIDGTVTRVNTKVGRFADDTEDKEPLFVIENIEKLQVKLNVSEYDIGKIQINQAVKIDADILKGEEVDGIVTRISPTGEEKQNSTERVIPIVIEVTGKNPKLIAGINVNSKILIAKASNALNVPIECVMEKEPGVYSVYKVDKAGKLEIITVEKGVEDNVNVAIVSDKLAAGDTVIVMPGMDLVDGSIVSVPKAPEESTEAPKE